MGYEGESDPRREAPNPRREAPNATARRAAIVIRRG